MDHDASTDSWSVIGEGADRGDAREITDRAGLEAALTHDEKGITRTELVEAMGSREQQWHGLLEHMIDTGAVVRWGAGKKGDPYRYKKLRTDAAQTPAHNPRSNGTATDSNAAAHPVGVQHLNQDAAARQPASGGRLTRTPETLSELR
jgi:hypothetical protein